MCATWHETDAPVPYDGLGPDEFTGWEARPSASARLMAVGVGVLVGIALGHWAAPTVAGWLSG